MAFMMQRGRLVSTGKFYDHRFGLPCLVLTARRFMGAMTNNGRKLANFAGFYK
jgi:hypothetical protein